MQKIGVVFVAELVKLAQKANVVATSHGPKAHSRWPASRVRLNRHLASISGAGPMPAQPEPICIVDDDASVRNSIEQLLDSDGLKAQSFEDPEDFLVYARSHAVPLAILDVWMPKTSGLQVQAQLCLVSPNTMVTGHEISGIRTAPLEGGAFAFGAKPFDDEAFLALVHQALGSVA
jgi:CheY-like chemotaxis protein